MAFKMKGFSGFKGNSPLKLNEVKKVTSGKKEDNRTEAQKSKDRAELDRQTRIQKNFERNAKADRERKQDQLKNLGFFVDDDGKHVHAKRGGATIRNLKKTR